MFKGIKSVEYYDVDWNNGGGSWFYITDSTDTIHCPAAKFSLKDWDELKAECARDGGTWKEHWEHGRGR